MASLALDVAEWAAQQFGACDFGDERRTKRMVKFAAQAAANPDAATPEQTERWADCKAAYRLFDQEEVTFEAVIAPHCAVTRGVKPGVWLVINDTTELDFGYARDLPGVGRVGSGPEGRGFYLHTALVVSPEGEELVGVAAQELYARPLKKVKRVSSFQRKQLKTRETDIWGRVIDRVGPPSEKARFIHVCDRGADNFDVYCHLLEQQAGWVIRAAQLRRLVLDDQGIERSLDEIFADREVAGSYTLEVRANQDQPARTARLEVRWATIRMPRPGTGVSHYGKHTGIRKIPMRAVEVREVRPPRGVKTPLRWVLLTSERVQHFNDAWRVIEHYERRPLVEEYHKCLKTGCRVESRQYRTGDRLAPVIGLLSVLAVRLLQLKLAARTNPDQPAIGIVPTTWLKTLPLVLKSRKPIHSLRDFFRSLASLGGFLGRKGDGEPGWQTVWRGLHNLLLCLRGAEAIQTKCG
jgi:Transposase DNA-binding/Transposase Tn5 dimerisation domain